MITSVGNVFLLFLSSSYLAQQSRALIVNDAQLYHQKYLTFTKKYFQLNLMQHKNVLPARSSIILNSVETPESEDDKTIFSMEDDRNTKIDRIKFRLSEMKRDLLAAELRAIEAEEKVEVLQNAMESEDDKNVSIIQEKFEEKINELKEKAKFFKASFEKLKVDSKEAIKNVTENAEAKEAELTDEINTLTVSRDEESSKAILFETKNTKLSTELKEMTFSLEAAKDAVKLEREKVNEFKRQLTLLDIQFHMEMSKFKENTRSEKEELIREIMRAKDDIWTERRKAEIELKEMKRQKDQIISGYKEERESIRTMMKQSFRLMKKRIVNTIKR